MFSDSLISFHMLGQEKLRGFVESEPRDRLETLAPIIGVDRYTDLTETLIALSHALSERLNEQNRRLVVKKQNLDSLERKKQDTQQVYERSIRTDRNLTDWLGEEFNSFRDSLPEGLQSDIQNIPRQDIRELILFLEQNLPVTLAAITQHYADATGRLYSAEGLISQITALKQQQDSASTLRKEVQAQEQDLERILARRSDIQRDINRLKTESQDIDVSLSKLRSDTDSLLQLKTALQSTETLTEDLDRQRETQITLEQRVKGLKSTVQSHQLEIRQIESTFSGQSERIQSFEKFLSTAHDLEQSLRELVQGAPSVDRLKDDVVRLMAEQQSLSEQLLETRRELNLAELRQNTSQEQFERISRTQSQYHSLLAELRQFVSGSRCPLCSTEFVTRERLLASVDDRLSQANPELEFAARAVHEAQTEFSGLRQRQGALSNRLQQIERDLQTLQIEVEVFDSMMRSVHDRSRILGIDMEPDHQTGLASLQQRITGIEADMGELILLMEH